CSPDAGVIEVMIGTLGVIRNPSNTADVPVEVVTCKVRAATLAPGAMFTVIGSIVSLPPPPIVAVTPDPLNVTAVGLLRLEPVMVASIVVPCVPDAGLMERTLGTLVCATVNPEKEDETE